MVNFHIPDILNHHRINIILYEMIHNKISSDYFREDIKIASVYGSFPSALWNGGRFLGGPQANEQLMKSALDDYNSRGIPVRFTFTNPLITKEHLGNPYCNKILRIANNGLNEVIVNSPILEEYIRENYPDYKITSSTCKEIRDAEGVNAELAKPYNLVVLDYNWNNNFEFLESIEDKARCELLINACCIPNCPRRGEHYRSIGQSQIDNEERIHSVGKNMPEREEFKCEFQCQNLYKTTEYKTHISPDDLYNKYVPMGFNQFKIEGRTNMDVSVMESFIYYMVKPEYKDMVRLMMSEWLTDKVKYFI